MPSAAPKARESFEVEPLLAMIGGVLRRLFARQDVQFALHCIALMAMLTVVRPMFTAGVSAASYQAKSVVWDIAARDIDALVHGAQRQHPEVPRLLFLIVPTLIAVLSRERITWNRWESGRALRVLVFVLLFLLAWTGSTFDYNLYVDRGHAFDRILLVALLAYSWRSPLAVPPATALAYIMIKEASLPYPIDDFDFRSVADVLIVFSCFVWASLKKSFATKHFLWVALGAWASYYFCAGVAKVTFGPSNSWLLENHLSNLSVGSYVRGWLGFIPEGTFLSIAAFAHKTDRFLAFFSITVELGSLVMFHFHPKTARLWLLLCALFHLGIFLMTGICFWKWFATNLALFWFVSRGAPDILRQMTRYKLAIALAVVSLYYSNYRFYFFPQTHVVWYDSRLVENYEIVAVGADTGKRYIVDPSSITPMEVHWVQGRLCEATDEESVTGIYGVTGSYSTFMALENAKSAEEGLTLVKHGHRCTDPAKKKTFDEFMSHYFRHMNQRGGRPWHWLTWFRPPTHLWVEPRGHLYESQEPVARIELWREVVVHQGNALHRFDRRMVHQVAVMDAQPPAPSSAPPAEDPGVPDE